MSVPTSVYQENGIEYILPTEDVGEECKTDFDDKTIDFQYGTVTGKDKRKVNAMKRMKGQKYMGYTKTNGMLALNSPKPQREMGATCSSTACIKSKVRHCQTFDDETRRDIFKTFWSMTWNVKQVFVNDHVSQMPKKRETVENSKKKYSFRFTLPYKDGTLQVCRSMFQSTLCISNGMVKKWIKSNAKTLS